MKARTKEEKVKNLYENNKLFKKFIDDKALDRINSLTSAAHLLINVAMAFEAESENILGKYGLLNGEIKQRSTFLAKAYDKYMQTLSEYYTDTMSKNFAVEFDKLLDDMFCYLGMEKTWEPGQKDDHCTIGFQNALTRGEKNDRSQTFRYVQRTPTGKVFMSTHIHGTAIRMPAQWFRGLKKGEMAKVLIKTVMKY